MNQRFPHSLTRLAMGLSALTATAAFASTDISTVPLWASIAVNVKPNILFVLDDSGSMADDFLPDDANFQKVSSNSAWAQPGRLSSQCNGLAFNPDLAYPAPVKADGSAYPDTPTSSEIAALLSSSNALNYSGRAQSVTQLTPASDAYVTVALGTSVLAGAYVLGMPVTVFDNSSRGNWVVGTVSAWDSVAQKVTLKVVQSRNLPGSGYFSSPYISYGTPGNQLYYTYDTSKGGEKALNYVYPTGSVSKTSAFYTQCAMAITDPKAIPAGLFNVNIVTPSMSADFLAKYWRWATYYSYRMAMMRSAASLAFQPMDERFRIGFTTILEKNVTEGSRMLHVRDFDKTQKEDFYTKLFGVPPSGYTPLRGAVQKAGRYFANKYPGQDYDPMQYSCQKNFLVLSTDGYWNNNAEYVDWDTTKAMDYGPYDINGELKIGNQDGLPTPRPMFDGSSSTVVSVDTWTVTHYFSRVLVSNISYKETTTKVNTESQTLYSLASDKSCTGGTKRVWGQPQTRSATYTQVMSETLRTDNLNMSQPWNYTKTTTTLKDGETVTSTVDEPAPTKGAESVVATVSTSYNSSTGAWTGPTYGSWKNGTAVKGGCATSPPADLPPTVVSTSSSVAKSGSRTAGTTVSKTDTDTSEVKSAVTNKTTTTNVTGTLDSLADVAMYYYKTDLRTSDLGNCTGSKGIDVCENNVKVTEGSKDDAKHQHMTTYTLSLGNSGMLGYEPDYETSTAGDFYKVKTGVRNWPNPFASGAAKMDDLWHAAVNGRGRYFNAKDPSGLALSLATALNSIASVTGTAAAAATSTLQPVAGDNGAYVSQFTSPAWTGDLRKYTFDKNGKVEATRYDSTKGAFVDNAKWSAADMLTSITDRKIKFFRKGGAKTTTGSLVNFDAASMTADELALFAKACDKPSTDRPSQCASASPAEIAALNDPATMVSYLRGVEQTGYRPRSRILGDLVNSSPVFIGQSKYQYTENGYQSWVKSSAIAGRTRILVVGGNDGMLHAFRETDGSELWAYVPSSVMSKMYILSDKSYESKHTYFVDGSPIVSDIYVDGAWKTILIGGLGAGGRSYYALDVTDTENPKPLWEISPDTMPAGEGDRLGLAFSNPVVTKRADGTWIVALASGYNNPSGGAYLFILDAKTGELLQTIPTEVEGVNVGEGMAKVNAWIDSPEENLALRFYGGDMLGNLWRFDIDGLLEPKKKALRLAVLKNGDGQLQPITTLPKLAEFDANGGRRRVIYVGTGRYLGKTDIPSEATPAQQQSIYAIADDLSDKGLDDVRGAKLLVEQKIDTSTTPYTVGSTETMVDWSKNKGWFVDLKNKAERVNIDMLMVANTLVAAGNIPGAASTYCEAPEANQASLYMFNIITGGGTVQGLTEMQAGISAVMDEFGKYKTVKTGVKSGVNQPPDEITPLTVSSGAPRRSTWRELH